MWVVQILKRGIDKTRCKPVKNFAKIQMSQKHVLPPPPAPENNLQLTWTLLGWIWIGITLLSWHQWHASTVPLSKHGAITIIKTKTKDTNKQTKHTGRNIIMIIRTGSFVDRCWCLLLWLCCARKQYLIKGKWRTLWDTFNAYFRNCIFFTEERSETFCPFPPGATCIWSWISSS